MICLLTALSTAARYDIDPNSVGRLEVGTETLVDKSKSTKTVLMQLFPNNTDVEGATVVNACYGGTAALWNAIWWAYGNPDKYAIVVAADIAAYARGPARPTSGAGAVALLVGKDAPLAAVPDCRATHAANVWDFFKPDPSVEYPVVNGALSQVCYYRALEDVYQRFADKMAQHSADGFDATTPDFFCFHAPYNKLVQKSYARLFLMDAKRCREGEEEKKEQEVLHEWIDKPVDDTYTDKALEKKLKELSAEAYRAKMTDSNFASQQVGNTYTASVFFGLASLIDRAGPRGDLSPGKKIVMFSYGSGALATMYLLQTREPTKQTKFTLDRMMQALQLTDRLAQREKVAPGELDHALETRARMHRAGAPYSPVYPTMGRLFPGTYYLNGIDAQWIRTYSRVPLHGVVDERDVALAPPIVLRLAQREAVATPVIGKLQVLLADAEEGGIADLLEARRRIACVITGTAAGLPGAEAVFHESNLERLVRGSQCITPIGEDVKSAMLDKNVVQLTKFKDGTTQRNPVNTEEKIIKLAAQLGHFDLTDSYGVPMGLAQTMDVAAQVAVAAGMEALKNAGLVRGRSSDPKEWMLPEEYRDTTGVVYASSFPAMDAAVGEVMRFLKSKTVSAADTMSLLRALRNRLLECAPEMKLSDEDEAAFERLTATARETGDGSENEPNEVYEFDRKFLFRVLVLGNSQLAQLAGCRGPNAQTNAACAGTTQAIAMAQDMLISGRAQRVVVVAGDNASGDTLLPWLGSGFRALGAATTQGSVEDAAMPFDKRRSGLLLGAGGIGMVLETETSTIERQLSSSFTIKARLLATQYSNSAYHGAALDRRHIGQELDRFLNDIELLHGISRAEIATHGVYFSHETSTHASDASSCAGNEVAALRSAFCDDLLPKMLIVNTKGFTGHPMGVSFEDVAAVEVLMRQQVPAVPNYKEKDDYLGDLKISKGGPYACRYALRFAAGFGSQVAFALYATAQCE